LDGEKDILILEDDPRDGDHGHETDTCYDTGKDSEAAVVYPSHGSGGFSDNRDITGPGQPAGYVNSEENPSPGRSLAITGSHRKEEQEISSAEGYAGSDGASVMGLYGSSAWSCYSPVMNNKITSINCTGMVNNWGNTNVKVLQELKDTNDPQEGTSRTDSYYRTLVELSPDAIIVTDPEGMIRYRSAKADSLFGVPPDMDVIGTSLLNWVDSPDQLIVIMRIRDLLNGNALPERKEYRLRKYDGTVFWGEIMSSPVSSADGSSAELLVVCRDVTERKQTEEELIRAKNRAEENDRLKTAFLQNISHEIRTPMNAIVGFASLLGGGDLPGDIRKEYTDIIIDSSNHLLKLLNEILDVASIEAGTLQVKKDETCINTVFRSIHNQFSERAKEKKISLIVDTPLPDDVSVIVTDGVLLKQVLYILTDNALKFTDSGQVHLGYTCRGNSLGVFVSDTGIGIKEHYQKKIFERFYRVDPQGTRLYEGLGLGLTIARAYVEALGGDLKLTSFPGLGSKFYFNIPHCNRKDPYNDYGRTPSSASRHHPGTKKILAAMDINPENIQLWHFLNNFNFDLVYATDGAGALDIFRKDTGIVMVLLDAGLPEMNCSETVRIMKEMKSWIPVVVRADHGSEVEMAVRYGCDRHVQGTLDAGLLLRIIGELVYGERYAS
jgi:PAS domain S-box-containing protein